MPWRRQPVQQSPRPHRPYRHHASHQADRGQSCEIPEPLPSDHADLSRFLDYFRHDIQRLIVVGNGSRFAPCRSSVQVAHFLVQFPRPVDRKRGSADCAFQARWVTRRIGRLSVPSPQRRGDGHDVVGPLSEHRTDVRVELTLKPDRNLSADGGAPPPERPVFEIIRLRARDSVSIWPGRRCPCSRSRGSSLSRARLEGRHSAGRPTDGYPRTPDPKEQRHGRPPHPGFPLRRPAGYAFAPALRRGRRPGGRVPPGPLPRRGTSRRPDRAAHARRAFVVLPLPAHDPGAV